MKVQTRGLLCICDKLQNFVQAVFLLLKKFFVVLTHSSEHHNTRLNIEIKYCQHFWFKKKGSLMNSNYCSNHQQYINLSSRKQDKA